MKRRMTAYGIGVAGIARQGHGLTAAAAEIDFLTHAWHGSGIQSSPRNALKTGLSSQILHAAIAHIPELQPWDRFWRGRALQKLAVLDAR